MIICSRIWIIFVFSFSGGGDYSPLNSSLTFLPGIATVCVDIDIIDNTHLEDDEQFSVELSSDDRVDIELSSSVITIRDDDSKLHVHNT